MRARNLKPGFFVNEQLAECCFAARILFEGLWCLADREGRLEDKPKKIKALVFPYDDIDANELLQELHTHGLIVRYEVDGAKYIDIPKFKAHQRPHQNETASIIPPRTEPLAQKAKEVRTKDERTCDQGEKDLLPRNKALRPESLILNPEYIKPKRIGQPANASSADAAPLEGEETGMSAAQEAEPSAVSSPEPASALSGDNAPTPKQATMPSPAPTLGANPAHTDPPCCGRDRSEYHAAADRPQDVMDFDLKGGPPERGSPPGRKNSPTADKPAVATPDQIAELWNGIMPKYGFAKVVSLSDKRRRHVKARQREFRQHGAEQIDFWRTVFAEVQKIPFLRGENDRGWRADFDFCTESQDKLLRIIEGKYRSDKQIGTRWEAY